MLKDTVRKDMLDAMKNKDTDKKNILSILLNGLQMAEKEKKSALTEAEEAQVVLKLVKQVKETIDSAKNREDIRSKAENELAAINVYAPKMMDEAEITGVINEVLAELDITAPSAKDKGNIMKVLMPRVKGKADGALVNKILGTILA